MRSSLGNLACSALVVLTLCSSASRQKRLLLCMPEVEKGRYGDSL